MEPCCICGEILSTAVSCSLCGIWYCCEFERVSDWGRGHRYECKGRDVRSGPKEKSVEDLLRRLDEIKRQKVETNTSFSNPSPYSPESNYPIAPNINYSSPSPSSSESNYYVPQSDLFSSPSNIDYQSSTVSGYPYQVSHSSPIQPYQPQKRQTGVAFPAAITSSQPVTNPSVYSQPTQKVIFPQSTQTISQPILTPQKNTEPKPTGFLNSVINSILGNEKPYQTIAATPTYNQRDFLKEGEKEKEEQVVQDTNKALNATELSKKEKEKFIETEKNNKIDREVAEKYQTLFVNGKIKEGFFKLIFFIF